MKLHALICPNCGQPLQKEDDHYRCRYCLSFFEPERADGVADALSSALEADKIERLANARKLLYDATHHEKKIAKYPVKDTVLSAASKVLSIHQEEPFADIVLHSYDADPYVLVQTLSRLHVEPSLADDIFRWLLPSLTPRLVGPLNDFVCRHYRDQERTDRLNELEDEAEKLGDGTYVHTLNRDVFLAYSSSDMPKALEVIDALEENGLTVFAAFRNLRHGKGAAENYLRCLESAMRACSVFVFLSSDSSRSMTCDAMKVELPYLTTELLDKPRVEYILNDYPDRMPIMVRATLKNAFPEQEQCRGLDSLVMRVFELKSSAKKRSQKIDEEALRKKIEEETRKKIEEENAKKAEEERRKKAEEEARRQEEENKRKAEEERLRLEAEAKKKAEEEDRQRKEAKGKQGIESIVSPKDFEISDGKLIKYKGLGGDVVIPDGVTSIGNKAFCDVTPVTSVIIPSSVTSIEEWAFYGCRSMKSVVIPEGISSIGSFAFAHCSDLGSIEIPSSVTFIGRSAFDDCSLLRSVRIPAAVAFIEDGAFSSCTNVEEIRVDPDNPYYDSREDCNAIIKTVTNTLIAGCPHTKIPASVSAIGSFAFFGLSSLQALDIPSSVTSIGWQAFSYCRGLESISLPSKLNKVCGYAFSSCSGLKSLTIPPSVEKIEKGAFEDCKCDLSIANAKKSFLGKWNYPEGYDKKFLEGFKGNLVEYEEEERKRREEAETKAGAFRIDGNYIYYGRYPQAKVNDKVTVNALKALKPGSNGYIQYNGEEYAEAKGEYYLVQPIRWRILERKGNEALVVSDRLLDAHRYNESYDGLKDGHYANNYKESEIRAWLNGEFLSSTFPSGDERILTTEVDNSAATTVSSTNVIQPACENTRDKVFLLSYRDYMNASYGFAGQASRQCSPTDYAMAKGAYKDASSVYGWYWTRSPSSNHSDYAWYIHNDGHVGGIFVSFGDYGVRPGLWINIAE